MLAPDQMPIRPPRPVDFNRGAKILRRAIFIGVGLSWILFGRLAVRDGLKAHDYNRDRREASGIVQNKKLDEIRTAKGRKRTGYVVTFRFADESGVERSGHAQVSELRYNELEPDVQVSVIYQASDLDGPKWIDGDAEHQQMLGWTWKVKFFVLVVVLIVGLGIDCGLRLERSLARNGIATRGMVKSITEHTLKGGTKTWSVAYEFKTENRERRNGYSFIRNRERAYSVPVGETVIVLYEPERPWRHRLLWSLRNVDPLSLLP